MMTEAKKTRRIQVSEDELKLLTLIRAQKLNGMSVAHSIATAALFDAKQPLNASIEFVQQGLVNRAEAMIAAYGLTGYDEMVAEVRMTLYEAIDAEGRRTWGDVWAKTPEDAVGMLKSLLLTKTEATGRVFTEVDADRVNKSKAWALDRWATAGFTVRPTPAPEGGRG